MIFDQFVRETFVLVLLCSALPLLCSSASGFLVSLLQALTQIQEQTIAFTVKFFTLCAVLWLAAGHLGGRLLRFFEEICGGLAFLGRLS